MIGDNPNIQTGASVERGRLAGEPAAVPQVPPQELRTTTKIVTSTSATFALIGAAGVVLAILSLLDVIPRYLVPIAAIVLGAGLLLEGGGMAARYRDLVEETHGDYGKLSLGGGLGFDAIGGAAAVVLGILALIGLVPQTLLACSVIVLGAAIMAGTSAMVRVNNIAIGHAGAHPRSQEAAREAVVASANGQAFIGAGAVVLGILALVGVAPLVLIEVALLAIGVGALISGSALVGRMTTLFAH